MKASRAFLVLLLLAGTAVTLRPQVASAQVVAVARSAQSQEDEDKAVQVRDQFLKVLRQYPPSLGTVWKADPSVVTDQYLAPYPAMVAFLSQHPEVRRNSAWYLEPFRQGSEGYYFDPRQRS